mmetsp:Transcript_21217/g.48178  ORF Transcript_21217/g.48178 Transcript_21217/m.48178 type:complete len:232 (+) Transcript_21217:1731-2426(+)
MGGVARSFDHSYSSEVHSRSIVIAGILRSQVVRRGYGTLLRLLRLMNGGRGFHWIGSYGAFGDGGRLAYLTAPAEYSVRCFGATSADTRDESRGNDETRERFRGPILALFVPGLSQNVEEEAPRHFGGVGRFKIGCEVVCGATVPQKIDSVGASNLFGSGPSFYVRELGVEILRTRFTPGIYDFFRVGEKFVHMFYSFPSNLPRQSNLEGTLRPPCSILRKILIELIMHKL